MSIKVNGSLQHTITVDNYAIHLYIKSGLAYLTMQQFTDREWDMLQHVIMITNTNWDSSILI